MLLSNKSCPQKITVHDLIDIDENEGETLIGRNFYWTGKAFLIGFVLFTVFPVILSVILAYFGGVFTADDTDALPFVEDCHFTFYWQ